MSSDYNNLFPVLAAISTTALTIITGFWALGKYVLKKHDKEHDTTTESLGRLILVEARVTAVELLIKTGRLEDDEAKKFLQSTITTLKEDVAFIRGQMVRK